MSNLFDVKKILLIRCENGWLACDEVKHFPSTEYFVFASTDALAKALPSLIGESTWEVKAAPLRDEKGHFIPRKKEDAKP